MESLSLVYGGDKKVNKNYAPRSLARLDLSSGPPFWLDLVSPSELLLHRILIPFRFHPRVLKACLSRFSLPGCEDFGDYLFIKFLLLEPSKRTLFIQIDMNIFLSSRYLITIHKLSGPLGEVLLNLQKAQFTYPTTLLLTLFVKSLGKLEMPIRHAGDRKIVPIRNDRQPSQSGLWWRLKNLTAAFSRYEKSLNEIVLVGDRFFSAEQKNSVASIMAKASRLSEELITLVNQMSPPKGDNSAGGIRVNVRKNELAVENYKDL